MEEFGPIGEIRGFTNGAHEDKARSGELEACSVHRLLWLDTLGIVSRFFHVSGHQSWIIIEEVVPIGSTTGVDKGSPYDSTRR